LYNLIIDILMDIEDVDAAASERPTEYLNNAHRVSKESIW